MVVIVFGHRSFGSCDYFKLRDDSAHYCYVRTQFFHISFMPLCPIKSYLAISDGQHCSCANEKVSQPIRCKEHV